MQICGHLRCHYAEINAQRITIRLRFISAKFLASAPPICKSFGGKEIKSRKDKNGYSIFGGGVFDFCCSGW